VRLFRGDNAKFDAAETWGVKGLAVPGADTAAELNQAATIQGVTIELVAMAGKGSVTLPSTPAPGRGGSSSYSGTVGSGAQQRTYNIQTNYGSGLSTTIVQCELPHVAARIKGVTEDHLSPELSARDDQSRDVKVHAAGTSGEISIWFFEAAPDAKAIDLAFVVQKARTVEFLVKPPAVEPLKAVAADPDSPAAQARRAEQVQNQIAQWRNVLATNPSDPGACNNLAWALAAGPTALRNAKEAVELAERAVQIQPDNRYYANTLAVAYYRDGQFDKSVPRFEANIQNRADAMVCFDLYFLAMAQHQLDDKEKAEATLRRSIQVHRQRAAEFSREHAIEARGIRAEAVALIVGSTPAEAFASADQLARKGEWTAAADAFKRALAFFPDDHWQWYHSASLLAQLGDFDALREHIARMAELADKSQDAFMAERTAKASLIVAPATFNSDRAVSLIAQSRALAERSVQLQPNNAWFRLARGMAEYRGDNLRAAVEWLDKALAAQSKNGYCDAPAHLLLAMARHRLGETDEARQALQTAVELMEQFPKLDGGDLGDGWHDWLVCQILRREAESVVLGNNAKMP